MMTTPSIRALISPASPRPPPPPPPPPPLANPAETSLSLKRRTLVFSSLLPLLPYYLFKPPSPANAFSLGISGPKEWLKEQKKKAYKILLAPIDASRESLRTAITGFRIFNGRLGRSSKAAKYGSKRLCSTREEFICRVSSSDGVEVCTFRLIVKNASSLLDDRDPIKLEAEAMLGDLIRSFSLLDGVANIGDLPFGSNRQKLEDGLLGTISSLDKFERGIKDCLGV